MPSIHDSGVMMGDNRGEAERSEAADLIRLRFDSLKSHDFVALYSSYHPRSPFIEQFPSVTDYLEFAEQALSDITVRKARIRTSRKTAEGVELICAMRFELGGEPQTIYELALLLPTGDGLRYHSAQKLTTEDYTGVVENLSFADFDQASPKIRF